MKTAQGYKNIIILVCLVPISVRFLCITSLKDSIKCTEVNLEIKHISGLQKQLKDTHLS